MSSKIFIFSGHFGGGKSITAYSFVPPAFPADKTPHRLVLDHEIRFDTYKSPDDKDHPEKMQFAFIPLGKGRITPDDVFKMMELVHTKKYVNKPDVIVLDDVAMTQTKMQTWWQTKENALKTATLYGLEKERCLTVKDWKAFDPGTLTFFKGLFTEFMLDCKDQDITLILTSPLHNIWQNYGKPGYAEDKLPNMRIIGKSAKVWDCWQQMADVIWIFDRHDKKGKLTTMPNITMDVMIPKASLPGVPEFFEWPGWTTLWQWFEERKFVADVSKLEKPKPEFDQDTLDKQLKDDKRLFIKEMKGIATIAQITEALENPMAPAYTIEGRADVKEFVLQWLDEKKASATDNEKKAPEQKSATEEPKDKPVAPASKQKAPATPADAEKGPVQLPQQQEGPEEPPSPDILY